MTLDSIVVLLLWPAFSNLLGGLMPLFQDFKSWGFSRVGPKTSSHTKYPPLHPFIYLNSITNLSSPLDARVQLATWHLHMDSSKPLYTEQIQKLTSPLPETGLLSGQWMATLPIQVHRPHTGFSLGYFLSFTLHIQSTNKSSISPHGNFSNLPAFPHSPPPPLRCSGLIQC